MENVICHVKPVDSKTLHGISVGSCNSAQPPKYYVLKQDSNINIMVIFNNKKENNKAGTYEKNYFIYVNDAL